MHFGQFPMTQFLVIVTIGFAILVALVRLFVVGTFGFAFLTALFQMKLPSLACFGGAIAVGIAMYEAFVSSHFLIFFLLIPVLAWCLLFGAVLGLKAEESKAF